MESAGGSLHNQILAIKRPATLAPSPAGFRRVTAAPISAASDVLQVYATPETTLRIETDARADVHVYLWGLAGHPQLRRAEIPLWIAGQIAKGDEASLRQIVGSYIALIDNRRAGAVTIVSDVGGTRPFFVGVHDHTLVCGSHVWTLAEQGWIGRRLNYNAIAAWIRAGYDFTEGSLFSDLSLVEPGAASTFRQDHLCVKSYIDFQGGCNRPSIDDLLEQLHGIMTRSFRSATRELGSLQIAMSGGFDSRYLAAMATADGLDLRAACLNDDHSEGQVAAEVARRLGFSLEIIQTDGSRWNSYDDPFHFAPSGFPITKQQTYPVAIRNPGVPCLNGFLGDVLVRDEVDRLEGKLPSETTEDHARVFQRAQNLAPYCARFDLMRPDMIDRCDQRTLPACRKHIARYSHTANVFAAAMVLRRHRTYFGNNFVQHLAFAEPILPFANYELFQYKLQSHPDCFSFENYKSLLAKFFPKLADIPHNDKLGDSRKGRYRPSRVTRRWAMKALAAIAGGKALGILDARKTIPRLIAALRGNKNEIVALFAYRLYLLEKRLRGLDVELDWSAI